MGKISPVSAKYIIHANISIEGVVDKPDVIGAVFGQTEGLLGADLELRELQRSGRIGRIEVNTETRSGKTAGSIIVPSSLDKAETSIIAAALEIIQRIGPCNARIKVENMEDVRVSKRNFVVERAKELLKQFTDSVMPDSQELADEVMHSVRVMEIKQYGKDRLPAGPAIDESDEVIVVEGRADVLNLLKQGFKNGIAINGTSIPDTIIELSRKKVLTVFVDGDRGGDLIIRELMAVADIDYVTKAPDGKEVEELAKKEIHKALRSKIASEQIKMEISRSANGDQIRSIQMQRAAQPQRTVPIQRTAPLPRTEERISEKIPENERKVFKTMAEDLIGSRGAQILDSQLNILGKVPVTELQSTLKDLTGVHAVVFDGVVDRDLARVAEQSNVSFLVGMASKLRPQESKVRVVTLNEL